MIESVAGAKKKIIIALPLLMIGAGLILIGLIVAQAIFNKNPRNDFSVTPIEVSFPAPDLTLQSINGEEVSIKGFNQKIVLVNNWATWCPPCRDEMPTLAKYYEKYQDQDFTLIGIEAGDPLDVVSSFVEEYKLTFTILLDPNNKSLIAFHNDSLPSSYVIDRSGTVVLAWTGPINRTMLEKYVTPLIER